MTLKNHKQFLESPDKLAIGSIGLSKGFTLYKKLKIKLLRRSANEKAY